MTTAPTTYPTPGTEVQVTYTGTRGQVTLQGVVFANRYPHMRLAISSGGHIHDIPWAVIDEYHAP